MMRPSQMAAMSLVPAHDVFAILNQVSQQIEYFGLDRHQMGATAQLAPVAIESIILEQKRQLIGSTGLLRSNPSTAWI